jgi:hypothetical protein
LRFDHDPSRFARAALRVLSIVALAALVGLLPGPSTSAAARDDVGLPPFGVYLLEPDAGLAPRAEDARAGWAIVRVNWSSLQPAEPVGPAVLDPAGAAELDAVIGAFRAGGIVPVGLVSAAPGWAAQNPNGPLLPGKEEAYLSFLEKVVERYSASTYGVHHWMLWSEPDAMASPAGALSNRGAWGDNGDVLARLLTSARPRVKAKDPSATMILGPLAHDGFYDPGPGPGSANNAACGGSLPGFNCGGIFKYRFLDEFLVAGGGSAVDALGLNAYNSYAPGWELDAARNGRSGLDLAAKIGHVRARMAARGVSLPIIVGEAGFWSQGSSGWTTNGSGYWALPASATNQANYVAKAYARALNAGAAAIAWFTLDEWMVADRYGLLDESGNPKPAYNNYKYAATVLGSPAIRPTGRTQFVSTIAGSVESYGFTANREYTAVAWAAPTATNPNNPTARVAVPSAMTAYRADGTELPSMGNTPDGGMEIYDLTDSPVFFRWGNTSVRSVLIPITLRRQSF